jgi:antibiotic biosynthesis monooxygenase (ABM) superfamily enzyme
MEHEGKALAADETDADHHRGPGLPSVHVRAVATWVVIFPLAAVGLSALNALALNWPPVLGALVLTAVVVPTAVYFAVPRTLSAYARISAWAQTRTRRRATRKAASARSQRRFRARNPA